MVFSICLFSVQYRIWVSDRRTFEVGFNLFHQKISSCGILRSKQGGWISISVEMNGKMEKTDDLWNYIRCEKIMLILWPSLEIQLLDSTTKKTKPQKISSFTAQLRSFVARMPYDVKKKQKQGKSLRNNPRKSFSTILTFVQKNWANLPSLPSQNDTVSVFHLN